MPPKKRAPKETEEKQNDYVELLGQSPCDAADAAVVQGLKSLYKDKLLPIERKYLFHKFNQPEILDSELAAKPTVLLIGQYSTGKTTFIKHLIGMEYPEMHIGPEPTTDRFIAVVHGEEIKTIKGNALTGINELPFSGLSTFGSSFLNKFSAAVVPALLLKDINIIDTPGVLSGEKQRTSRGYDFAKVARWFAERSDLILLLFDCSKLDISDEFRSVIEELQPHEDKVHCVLNKADQLDQESLMRVYGALLWSMGRIFKGAEVARIYVGSFRDEEEKKVDNTVLRPEHKNLFDKDRKALMSYLDQLPKACSMRKVNEIVKRLRRAVVHVCVTGHLKAQMPYLWGKEATQTRLIERLDSIFLEVRRTYQLAEGDFPKIDEYKAALQLLDIGTFPNIDRSVLNTLQDMLLKDVPKITALVAGVGSHSSSFPAGNAKQQVNGGNDEDGYNDHRLPRMFFMSDDKNKHRTISNSTAIIIIAVALVAVIAAVIIASVFNEHKFLQEILEKFQNCIDHVSASMIALYQQNINR